MFMPGFGDHTIGRPEVCVMRWNTVICERRPPPNSGMTSDTLVVSANCPSSIARSASMLVNALVTEKMLNTESGRSGRAPLPSSAPTVALRPISPWRATISTAP